MRGSTQRTSESAASTTDRLDDDSDSGRPDRVIALVLVHHLAITASVPVAELVDWLASLGGALLVELPTREDPMVQKLLESKREGLHPDYERGLFERRLREAFDVCRTEQLSSGTRTLYHATPKAAPC